MTGQAACCTPHDEREGGDGGELDRGERGGAEESVQRRRIDQQGGEHEGERDTAEQESVGQHANGRSDVWSVRTANAVPIWQATMPGQATVVAWW